MVSCIFWIQTIPDSSKGVISALGGHFLPSPAVHWSSLVPRTILRQLSKFETVFISSAITSFPRAHGKTICIHLGAENTGSKIKHSSGGEADNTQMPTYNKMCINCALTGDHQRSPAAFCLQ